MDEPVTPAPPPPVPPQKPAPAPAPARASPWRRLLPGLAGYLLSTAAAFGLVVGAVWWLLATEAGTAWMLAQAPGVTARGVSGVLLGDFSAEQLQIDLPGARSVRLEDVGWRGLRLRPARSSPWLRVTLQELRARRVELRLPESPDSAAPTPPPDSLALPVALDVLSLHVAELQIVGQTTPLRELRARLSIGADDGQSHRVEDLQLLWDKLRLAGRAQVAAGGNLALAATLELSQQQEQRAGAEWQATAQLSGPLAAPQVQARLRARSAPEQPAQTLDARFTVYPFAAWPLGELQASARAFDLSAWHVDAPVTALDLDASASTQGRDQQAALSLRLNNRAAAGRWNEGRLPLREMQLDLLARPDQPTHWVVQTFEAELGTARVAAGRLNGSGEWRPEAWSLDTRFDALRPGLLDARAPQMRLSGNLRLDGSGFGGNLPGGPSIEVRGRLAGQLLDRGPATPVRLRIDASLNALRVELRELLAEAGEARAGLTGRLTRATPSAAWAARGQASLRDFDPVPWWPGREDSAWRKGPHELNATADFDLTLPSPAAAGTALQQLSQVRGRAQIELEASRLAGVPMSGSAALQSAPGGQALVKLQLDADGNRLLADARLGSSGNAGADRWDVKAEMPTLNRLQPLWRLLQDGSSNGTQQLGGALTATAQLNGRWPAVTTQGQLDASALRLGTVSAQKAKARWSLGSQGDAPLEALVELEQLAVGLPSLETIKLQLQGRLSAHTLELGAESKALPPAWMEAVQARPGAVPAQRTLARLQLQGSALGTPASGLSGWRGSVNQLELRGDDPATPAWVSLSRAVALELSWANGPLRAQLAAGRAELLGAGLTWSRIAWSAAVPGGAPALLDAEAQLEPLQVAPLLMRLQPRFGWGGDLRISGQLQVKSSPAFSADVVIERASGDLSVTDESGTRTLGLSDLRAGLIARDGVWNFFTGLAGTTLGQAAGAVVARTSPQATWPAADSALDGVLELNIASLGVWGPWLPPGWRLTGEMRASASIGGRFGAPEYTGQLTGKSLSVRNVLQGVDVRDGELSAVLLGDTARIERFTASAGEGSANLTGSANLGASPRAELGLRLERFQLLGRVDRRIVASGDATLKLDRDTLALDGAFGIDEGLIDFSRSEAPQLSDDVQVRRGEEAAVVQTSATPAADANTNANAGKGRQSTLNVRVQLGEKLRIRGQGLEAWLRGELLFTAPRGRLRVDGSVRTFEGTYRAYRQRLNIERGVLTFNGPIENPQLDIEAIRPNLDVRVGVSVTGTVLVPRVRLFSEPEMSDADKLSWLLRGRASEGQGSGDTALLQAAAMALLAGEEPSALDELFNLVGLDELSLRQSDSPTGGTIVSVGKQLSRNWYVGYERGLNATTGNWQLIYRIAQRFTVRAQSGEQNSIELIWSWRWN